MPVQSRCAFRAIASWQRKTFAASRSRRARTVLPDPYRSFSWCELAVETGPLTLLRRPCLISRGLVMVALALAAMGCRERNERHRTSGRGQCVCGGTRQATRSGLVHVGSMTELMQLQGNRPTMASASRAQQREERHQGEKDRPQNARRSRKTRGSGRSPHRGHCADPRLGFIGEVASSRSLAMSGHCGFEPHSDDQRRLDESRVTKRDDKTHPYVFRVCF